MTLPDLFLLRAVWGTREESSTAISERIWTFLSVFSSASGPLANRFWSNEPQMVTGDRLALDKLVHQGYERNAETGEALPDRGSSISLRQDPMKDSSVARISAYFRLGNTFNSNRMAPNSVVVTFGSDLVGLGGEALPVSDVVSQADWLVREFVRVWEPDAASLDCTELLRAQKVRGMTYPTVGFVTWFADNVVAGDLSVVHAAHRERLANGTLLSVDLTSDRLLEDGLALVDEVFGAGLLRPIPAVQGQ